MSRQSSAHPPLVAHIIYRLDIGGLENGLVNLINHMPAERYRHAIICLTEATDFKRRIRRCDVEVISLGKREGKDLKMYLRLWRVLRALRPDIVHTRNLGTLDCMPVAMLAGVSSRIHGEHGRDVSDPFGENPKGIRIRKTLKPLVDKFIPMSCDLAGWLHRRIGVESGKIAQIYSGVDTTKFCPNPDASKKLPIDTFDTTGCFVIGAVGRFDPIKNPLALVEAFIQLLDRDSAEARELRLVYIGEGPLRARAFERLEERGVCDLAWLPGAREDVANLMRSFDVFVLPSRGEGISNTVLEAMATGLPVVTSDVGENPELLVDGESGALVPADDTNALADAICQYIDDPEMPLAHGRCARERVEQRFSLNAMVAGYQQVYDEVHGVNPV